VEPEIVVSIQDVTKSKRLQELLVVSGKMSAVGKLAAGIAHELNNPLTVILGSVQSELMQSRSPSAQLPGILKDIEREATRCSHLVKELLSFARVRPIGKVLQSPAALLHQALTLVTAQAKMKQVRLIQRIEPKLPPIRIDSDQFSQIVLNLCSNAIDAMPQGGVLTVSLDRNQGMIELRVADTGEGIPPDLRSRIFDPFFTTKGLGKGTGLGLSLVDDIIKNHSGTIEIENAPGPGTTFAVRLPLSPAEAASV
jgi:two-component system NtrC family sensor kinase